MGRVGACGDNATMEWFFALLQKNVLDRQRGLGRLTPIEYETINKAAQAA
jgi:putative transposase